MQTELIETGSLQRSLEALLFVASEALSIEALVKQATELLEFMRDALTFVAQVVEGQQLLGNHIDTRVDRLGQLQPTLVAEGLGLAGQLLIDLEVAGRHIINQQTAELLQGPGILCQRIRLGTEGVIGPHELMTLLQPAIDQQMHSTPAFLSIPTTFEHGDLSSLMGNAARTRRKT